MDGSGGRAREASGDICAEDMTAINDSGRNRARKPAMLEWSKRKSLKNGEIIRVLSEYFSLR